MSKRMTLERFAGLPEEVDVEATPNKIWCMFSVANLHDQPGNNLVAWWPQKPSLGQVSSTLGYQFENIKDDNLVLTIVKIWQGESVRVKRDDTDYWVEEVVEGKKL